MLNNNNGYPSSTRAWVTVAILMVAYVLSFIDRQILNLLVGPIRRDLMISDTQMSLFMGLSFALFYTVCGIPLGRLRHGQAVLAISALSHWRGRRRGGVVASGLLADCRQFSG